jgi:hypothetical protein
MNRKERLVNKKLGARGERWTDQLRKRENKLDIEGGLD